MRKKSKNKKFLKKIIIGAIIFLTLIVAALIILETDVLEKKERVYIEVNDECSLMLNRIIHQIKTDAGCKMKCINECNLRELEYSESKFIEKQDSCHECKCYCE